MANYRAVRALLGNLPVRVEHANFCRRITSTLLRVAEAGLSVVYSGNAAPFQKINSLAWGPPPFVFVARAPSYRCEVRSCANPGHSPDSRRIVLCSVW